MEMLNGPTRAARGASAICQAATAFELKFYKVARTTGMPPASVCR